jgi:hypothetical protein
MDIVFPLALPKAFEFCLTEEDWEDPVSCYSFIMDLKEQIPARSRPYDHKTRTWTVDERYLDVFKELRQEYFGDDPNQQELFEDEM